MQENNRSEHTNDEINAAPASSTHTAASAPQASAVAKSPLWKDLLIPGSIIVAGAFVGFGMYFSGGGGGVASAGQAAAHPQQTLQEVLYALVDEAGVEKAAFDACMENNTEQAARVQEDVDNAVATGGRGTPWSVVVGPTGKTYPLNGAMPLAAVEQVIELARSEGDAPQADESLNTDAYNPITEADYIKGSADAAVTIIEYSDFDCPFCSRFHTTMNQVSEKYDDIAWVYRHFPLDQLHPNASTIAVASECVGELGGDEAFWTFADGYFGRS